MSHFTATPSIDSDRNLTEPSAITKFRPLGWKAKGSSLGPQLFVCHGHSAGPPIGTAFWLMTAFLEPVELLGPE